MNKRTKEPVEAELKELQARVEKLEAFLAASGVRPKEEKLTVPRVSPQAKKQNIGPEIILAITAAVAAFLGKRASIHQIHLTGATAWAAQGRATVQASHGIVRSYR
jgi:methylmalonyl-CoA carboxyltransferase large subunit